ncbi:hypothetical protein Trydic_g17766 [Trypoxylus dichotomus]
MGTIENLRRCYPGRQAQINLLFHLFRYEDEPIPDTVFIHGCSATGKSTVTVATLNACNISCAVVNLIECYTSKILFETILNKLTGHVIDPVKAQPYARCDNMMDFIYNLRTYAKERDLSRSVIILDKAERLRTMDANILAGFLRLRELCDFSISLGVVFISELPFQKYYFRGNIVEPLKIHFPQYNIKELDEILSLDFDNCMNIIRNNCDDPTEIDLNLYKSYIHIFLSVFYRNCRDLNELKYISRMNFLNYCAPLINGKCKVSNAKALWTNISPILKSSLDNLYLRVSNRSDDLTISHIKFSSKNLAQTLELPFYGKYLLIAAYLASYNSPKDDKRLFVKHHGRKTKTLKDVKAKSKVSEQLSTQLGPKAFSFDRLIAIFYAILDDKVNFNNNLLAQLSSLVELQLLTAVSDGCNLDGQKYKCTVGFDVIHGISTMVEFNIRKYLSDFSHM